jgi:hypothetical protein
VNNCVSYNTMFRVHSAYTCLKVFTVLACIVQPRRDKIESFLPQYGLFLSNCDATCANLSSDLPSDIRQQTQRALIRGGETASSHLVPNLLVGLRSGCRRTTTSSLPHTIVITLCLRF